jgi:hypothetical protein
MVNPGKLKALVDSDSSNPMAAISNPSVGEPEPDGDEDYDDEDEESEDIEASGDPLARGNDLISQWGELGETMKEEAGEIVDGAHDVGADLLLAKIPEDAIDEVHKNFDRMPDELQWGLAKYVSKLTADDATAVATALLDGHDGDTKDGDLKLVTIYLQQLGTYAAEEVDPDDIPEEEPEEDEDEEGDEGEGATAAEGATDENGVGGPPEGGAGA